MAQIPISSVESAFRGLKSGLTRSQRRDNVDDVVARVRAAAQKIVNQAGQAVAYNSHELLDELKQNTTYAFQTVESYIYESNLGLPGRRSYPPGTIGRFAKTRGSIKTGTPWSFRVQTYIEGDHKLTELLEATRLREGRGALKGHFSADVGYAPGVGDSGSDTHYIAWVMFGTAKMVPRPFLNIALDRNEDAFLSDISGAIEEAIRNA